MVYSIRPATLADYDAVCAIYLSIDAFHALHAPEVLRLPSGPSRPYAWFESRLRDSESCLLVADVAGEIVGVAAIGLRSAPNAPQVVPRRWAEVETIGVLEAWRGQGIGTALLQACHAWARAQGVQEVELSVWEFNERARALYERQGYTTTRRTMTRRLDE